MQHVFGKYACELGPNSIRYHFHLGLQGKLGLQMGLALVCCSLCLVLGSARQAITAILGLSADSLSCSL